MPDERSQPVTSADSNGFPMARPRNFAALRPALEEMLKAWDYSQAAQRNLWDFAICLDLLKLHQVTETDCRWLVAMGYAEHAHEVTRHEDTTRQFRLAVNLCFKKRTCFILTQRGQAFACELLALEHHRSAPAMPSMSNGRPENGQPKNGQPKNGQPSTPSPLPPDLKPVWDCERHELRYAGKLVKQFKWPAVNQETLLATFQEENWTGRIDDPLPPQPEQDSRRRLHDTVKCLNKNQKFNLLHFRGDGTGEGVCWELISENGAQSSD
jgi:hypothetical protein